jgi:hypothetical protein
VEHIADEAQEGVVEVGGSARTIRIPRWYSNTAAANIGMARGPSSALAGVTAKTKGR